MNPVLSMNEDEIIYISLSDIEFVDTTDSFRQFIRNQLVRQFIGKQRVLNGHYVLHLDLLQNKVLYSKKSATNSLSLLRPIVLASTGGASCRPYWAMAPLASVRSMAIAGASGQRQHVAAAPAAGTRGQQRHAVAAPGAGTRDQ
jgi:hypothetical protein